MVDYTSVQAGDDLYAPEHVGSVATGVGGDYVDFGLNVSADTGAGTFSVSEGKWFLVLDTALAEWTDDSGTSHSQTVHNVQITSHTDARSGRALTSTSGTNYVFAWSNYTVNDDPRILVNDTGTPTHPDTGNEVEDALEIARIDPTTGEVTPRNQFASAERSNLTVHDQLEDPAGVVHTDELADAADIRTDGEINTAVNQNATHGSDAPHEYYTSGDAVADINAEDSLDVDVAGEAGSVAGGNVTSPVAEAEHATEADNADTVGNIPAADFLRTDTKDVMRAGTNYNDHLIENLSGLTFAADAGPALDLRPNSDGSATALAHSDPDAGTEYVWRSNPGNGYPVQVVQTEPPQDGGDGRLMQITDDGGIEAPNGAVYSEDGRLASQTWVNQNHINAKGDAMEGLLDMQGYPLTGLDSLQSSSGPINVHDPVDFNDNTLHNLGDMPDSITFATGEGIKDERGGQKRFEIIPRVQDIRQEYGNAGALPQNEGAVVNMDDFMAFVESDSNDLKAYIDTGPGGPEATGGGRGVFEGSMHIGSLVDRSTHYDATLYVDGNARITSNVRIDGDLEVAGTITEV